jgi:hypothetical protein
MAGLLLPVMVLIADCILAQPLNQFVHRRGRIWEELWNDGMIGNGGGWDYLTSSPLGMFPGFQGFTHPVGGETNAINTFSNANFHNFRSGLWIAAADLITPGLPPGFVPTPTDFEFYASGAQGEIRGTLGTNAPIRVRTNYMEEADVFNPLLPEEMTESTWPTNLGLTVTRRSYVWSFPGYRDMIIYDYILKNTGDMVSILADQLVPNKSDFVQTLQGLYVATHSAISVSTKSQINFHSDLTAVQAGAFGWQPPYHDYYYLSDDGTLAFSYNYNGGKEPPPFDPYPVKDGRLWEVLFGPELQSPAAYGHLALYADPVESSSTRTTAAPDVLRIDTHKGGSLNGRDLDLEFFKTTERSPQEYYEFMTSPDLQDQIGNNGDRFNMYTFSWGPYTVAPGDSVRIVVAEIAGVMDYKAVVQGDPDGLFPDATIRAIRDNAELARNAVAWGFGAVVDGIPIAADAPEPPPAPAADAVNASVGTDQAAIAVTWDDVAETTTLADGSGSIYYNGLDDLDGYRIYRSDDFQYTSETEPPAFRGAFWDMIAEIPKADFGQFFDSELGKYRYVDEDVDFGRQFGYYVSAYNIDPKTWTSANGTVVNRLPELESGDHRRSQPTGAEAGPVTSFDIYVVPNPYVFGDPDRHFGTSDPFRIEFRNLPERATIRIYTVSGELVRTIEHGPDERGNLAGTAVWSQKTDSGLLVAPGLYVFHVESTTEGLNESFTGKLMILR